MSPAAAPGPRSTFRPRHAPGRRGRAPRARRAAVAAGLLVVAGLLVAVVSPAGAQRRPPAPPDSARRPAPADSAAARAELDSLRARLARAEAEIALVRRQLAGEAEAAVRTRSRTSLELTARVLTNAYWTSAPANDPGVPLLATPAPPDESGAVGVSVRQTRVGAALTVREVLGGTFDADVDVDFFGGARDATGNRPLFAEPRLRTLRAALRWREGSVMVGMETPLVSDLDPRSVAAVGVPLFSGAGNLWNWLPQVRASRELLGRRVRWAVQGAVLMPFVGTAYAAGLGAPPGDPYGEGAGPGGDAGERSGRPYLQTRLRARWGPEDPDAGPGADVRNFAPGEGPSELGVGLHRGWARVESLGLLGSGAATIDARLAFGGRFELRAEGYVGELVAGLGGGGIGQNFGRPAAGAAIGLPLRDVAGWGQLNVQLVPTLLAGAGCGADRVRDADRPVRARNLSCAGQLRWHPAQPLLVGLEYRRATTRYGSGRRFAVDHLNLALGFDL